jgi:insulin receptor
MRDPKSVVDARFSHVVLAILVVSVSQIGWVSSQDRKEHVCSNVDVRNNVTNFKRLNNCTVIEGFLQILLIEKSQAQDFENLTFPDLREITGYFLLYRVYGMKTLKDLFPNLTVIRGSKLYHNYAFVVYEMMHLQDIAMPKLVSIKRGAVRIEKNPALCYLNTIDWDEIAPTEGRFIEDNKPADVCPNNCPESCPEVKTTEGSVKKRHCWNNHSCQKGIKYWIS